MIGGEYNRTYGTPAALVRAEFFMDTERDGRASAEAGRDIFREVERVRVIIPGITATILVKNVTQDVVERWPDLYRAFKAGQEAPLEGTPLSEWPVLGRAQIAELQHMQLRTVEEVASMSDLAVQHIGMGGRMLRDRARGWLDEATREAHNTKLVRENEQLRGEVGTLKTQVEALNQQMMGLLAREERQRNEPPAAMRHVAAWEDPVERAKAQAPAPGGVSSSLDSLAAGNWRPRHHTAEGDGPVMPAIPEGGGEQQPAV